MLGVYRPGERQHLAVEPVGHQLVDESRGPRWEPLADHPQYRTVVVAHPLIGALGEQIDELVMGAVDEQLTEQPAQRRPPWPLYKASDQRVLQDRLDILVAQHRHQRAHRGGQLGGGPLGVARLRQPVAEPAADADPVELVGHHHLGEEVGADELAEVLSQRVFLTRDDRGMRDGQPQRVAEQSGHREPVSQPADHAGLSHCLHVPNPWGSVVVEPSHHIHHRRTQQERQRDGLHPA
jgi:hypothetical protein